MRFNEKPVWFALFSACFILVAGCSNQGTPKTTASPGAILNGGTDSSVTSSTSSGSGSGNALTSTPPYQFQVSGTGNHPQYVCIPAQSKLVLRMKPHANLTPLFPAMPSPVYSSGLPVYDGSPAYYNQLRARLSIQNTPAAWDYQAGNESKCLRS